MKEETGATSALQTSMSRRTFLKNGIRWGAGLLGAAVLGTGGYSTGVEPRLLEVVRTRLELPNLPASFRGVTIAHFSDIHFGYHFGLKRLQSLVDRISEEKADMICFTGDLVEYEVGTAGAEVAEILGRLKAPLGKFAVLGNHDTDKMYEVIAVLKKGGFRCLLNEKVPVERNGERIHVAGLEDRRPNLQNTMKGSTRGDFCLMLAHRPDIANLTRKYPVHLQLSGHSHGGQIRLPFYGPIKRVPGALLYPDGLVRIPGSDLQLYTNRGIGVTALPVRFMCRPELTIHTLG